ncbi:MAG: GAF domain-containing protein, partial [Myxococcota bacterium]
RGLAARWLGLREPPLARLGPLLAVMEDPSVIEAHGPECVGALAERDVDQAVALASALWEQCRTPDLAEARSRTLLQAGRIDEARDACLAALGEAPHSLADVPLLLALARLEGVAADHEARMEWITQAVTACGDTAPSAELRLERAAAALAGDDTARAEDDCLAVCAEPPQSTGTAIWLRARRMLSQVRERDEGPAAGLAVLDDIPAGLGDGSRERALIEGDRGRLLWHVGKPRGAAAAMEQAATFRRALPLVDRARLENNAGLGWYSAGDLVKAVACWERALLAFERIGAPRDANITRINLCQGYRELGRWARAETIGQVALTWARDNDAPGHEEMLLGNLGDVALWQRKFDLAERRYDEAQGVSEAQAGDDELTDELVELARRRCELAGLRGDDDWSVHLDTAEALTAAAESRDEAARVRAMRALSDARDGRQVEAENAIVTSLDELRAMGATGELAIARLWVAEAWLELGYGDRATEEAQAVVRYAEEFVRPPLQAWATEIVERARPDRSVSHVERLTEVAVRVAMQASLPEILRELAQAAVDLVEVDRALVVLAEADDEVRVVAEVRKGPEAGGPAGPSTPPSMSIVRRVLQSGREVVSGDLEERGDLRGNASVVAMNLRAAICMPLSVDDAVVGALYLDSRGVPGGDLWEAASLARGLAAHGAVAVRNAQLADELEQRATDAEGAHRFANALLRAVPTPVVVASEDGQTVDANDAAVAMLGGATRDDVPKRLPDCLDRLEGGLAEEYQLHVPRQRRAVPVRVRRALVETPDGTTV